VLNIGSAIIFTKSIFTFCNRYCHSFRLYQKLPAG